MIGAVGERHFYVDDGEAERTSLQPVNHAFLHRRNVVARHRAANDLFLECKAFAARQRADLQHHIAELAVTAGLFLVAATLGDRFADGLLIADHRRMRFDIDAEALVQTLHRHPKMHLALPPQHHVMGLRVVNDRE